MSWTTILVLSVCVALGGCGSEAPPGAPESPNNSNPPVVATATPTPTPTPPPVVQLTVHSETVALYIGGPSGIGYCTTYGGKTYCWDDGLHNAFLFFGAQNGLNSCNGACTSDTFAAPVWINTHAGDFITSNLPANRQPSQVMSGAGTTVDCTESSGVLTCPTFTLDSNQGGL